MHLLRLLVLDIETPKNYVTPEPLLIGDTNVTAQPHPSGIGHRFVLCARIKIESALRLDASGLIEVPAKERRLAEEALLIFADFESAIHRTRRSLSSPSPYVAFDPDSQEDTDFLTASRGIGCCIRSTPTLLPGLPTQLAARQLLVDRIEGIGYIANAQSQLGASGAFREYVRCFEAAFDTDKMVQLRQKLSEFLGTGSLFGYEQSEVRTWLDDRRHGLVHTRGRSGRTTELDILPIIQRVEQAAYDVLMNKRTWRSGSTDRRASWEPAYGTQDPAGSIFLTRGEPANMQFRFLDSLAGFPVELGPALHLPPPLFASVPDSYRSSRGQLVIRERTSSRVEDGTAGHVE